MPIRLGGRSRIKNCTYSCRSCNAIKGHLPFETISQVKSFIKFKNGIAGDYIYSNWLSKNKLEVRLVKSVSSIGV